MSKGTALVIGIGKEKPGEYTAGDDDADTETDDDTQAGADAARAFFEAGAKKDYAAAYDAFETLVAICKGEG